MTKSFEVFLDYSEIEDAGLMRLIDEGRSEALAILYDRYSRLVYSLALGTLSNVQLAEEITQEVFFRVWQNAGSYNPEKGGVNTWLSSITRYRVIDLLRRRRVRPVSRSVEWSELSPNTTPKVDGRAPEDQAVDSMRAQRVQSALLSLPEEQRDALFLAYFQGMTHREIAAELQEPLGTIKTRIRLGMQKLRKALEEDQIVEE
jgi:RNA polymerase sigma-70 factor (ECF subfamily)